MGGDGTAVSGPVVRRTVTVGNRRGLHARAAAKFVNLASSFDAEITVVKGEMNVSGRSIMGLMMLAAGPGSQLELRATGPQAEAALSAVAELFARNFDET
ncbi:MAG: HPr family phosphocarrier protein [Rhodospirillaceae bacterium]|nr:HPr family phosphocarrier protein [Rhodospirillaceae bacterium]